MSNETTPENELSPLAYHVALRDYLKTQESDTWRWFSSAEAQSNYADSLRLDLLKHTYRLDRTSHPELYEIGDQVRAKMALDIPLTVYQSQNSQQLNAALFYIPGEAHIVLEGQLLTLLSSDEIRSLLAHELSHYKLWEAEQGEFLIADRMIHSMGADPRAVAPHVQSARRFSLYTEIYADRGSLLVTGDKDAVISALIKIQTGLAKVSAQSYIEQANEIFSKTKVKTDELSHPEAYIRARALDLWSQNEPETEQELQRMIEGPLMLNEIDLISQVKMEDVTRQFLSALLSPSWFHTELVLGHARMFFEDFIPAATPVPEEELIRDLDLTDPNLQQYFSYLLLDFATIDPQLEQVPLAAALQWAERLNINKKFDEALNKELKLPKKEIEKLRAESEATLKAAELQMLKKDETDPIVS